MTEGKTSTDIVIEGILDDITEETKPLKDKQRGVYLIQSGETQNYKIGIFTEDPKTRLSQLQTGNPERLKIIRYWMIEEDHEITNVESLLHKQFRKKKIRGEWFTLEVKDMFEIEDCIAEFVDPATKIQKRSNVVLNGKEEKMIKEACVLLGRIDANLKNQTEREGLTSLIKNGLGVLRDGFSFGDVRGYITDGVYESQSGCSIPVNIDEVTSIYCSDEDEEDMSKEPVYEPERNWVIIEQEILDAIGKEYADGYHDGDPIREPPTKEESTQFMKECNQRIEDLIQGIMDG